VDFSCFGYHPYLESRLTIQEKWVLGALRDLSLGGQACIAVMLEAVGTAACLFALCTLVATRAV
jgi:hypothetical protein